MTMTRDDEMSRAVERRVREAAPGLKPERVYAFGHGRWRVGLIGVDPLALVALAKAIERGDLNEARRLLESGYETAGQVLAEELGVGKVVRFVAGKPGGHRDLRTYQCSGCGITFSLPVEEADRYASADGQRLDVDCGSDGCFGDVRLVRSAP